MRICSFLPSATEILYALGLEESVAGVTYVCDYPPGARTKPVVVNTRMPRTTDPGETDRVVNEFVARGESLYTVDFEALRRIQPDLIITQDLCRVCAASPGDLGPSLATLPRPPRVLSLSPRTLGDVWNDIRTVGQATGHGSQAEALVAELESRIGAVERALNGVTNRPRVLCLEWLSPPFIAGHWVPEMVERAGGMDVLGRAGEPGFRTGWDRVFGAQPDVVVVMPCGYHLDETVEEFRHMHLPPAWNESPAVRARRVFAVDASSYFSRHGPRSADGVEILAHLCHPDRASAKSLKDAVQSLC